MVQSRQTRLRGAMAGRVKMESFRRETELFLLGQQQLRKSPDAFGFKLLIVLHLISGQRLRLTPTERLRAPWRIVVTSIKIILLLTLGYGMIVNVSMLFKHFGNIKFALYLAAGFLGVSECVFRIIYTEVRRKRIEETFKKMQVALNYSILGRENKLFVKKLSRSITVIVAVLMLLIFVSLVLSYLSVYKETEEMLEEMKISGEEWDEQKMLDNQISIDVVEAWSYVRPFFRLYNFSITQIKLVAALFYLLSFLSVVRVIVSDVLFYSWYFIIIRQYKELALSLKTALGSEENSSELSEWIEVHNFINELLLELNGLSSPVIVFAVVSTGLQACILSFAILRMSGDINIVYMVVFGISSVYQVFVYCVIGQKIRNQAVKMHSEAYKGPWLKSTESAQRAALMICTVANEKVGHSLPGAPFFALSLEFFASMLSVVTTYFVILIQMK